MRVLETAVPGIPQHTKIVVLDEKGPGGAHHAYRVDYGPGETDCQNITFQRGPIGEDGLNGVQIEDLLAICRDRLACFQNGPFPCTHNEIALQAIDMALNHLHTRTALLIERGVEGRSEA